MAKGGKSAAVASASPMPAAPRSAGRLLSARPSALLDTRVVYCGDNLEQLAKLPDACVRLINIDYMRLLYVQFVRVLKKTASFYYHTHWHASQVGGSSYGK